MNEVWKDIKGFEGFYKISNTGKVRSLPRNGTKKDGSILKPSTYTGYAIVSLQKNGETSYKRVHTLVAEAFIPNPDNKREVNHIDGNKTNNNVKNLEWCTSSENQLHAIYVLKRADIKKVKQYTKDGKFIKEWDSISIAGHTLNIDCPTICNCCRNKRKSAGGFVWKYSEVA